MANNEPMSDERLAEIRAMIDDFYISWLPEVDHNRTQAACEELLTEVDRLRAENTAMRALLREVIDVDERGTYINTYDDGYYADCQYCGATSHDVEHKPDCLITKAHTLLATSPDVPEQVIKQETEPIAGDHTHTWRSIEARWETTADGGGNKRYRTQCTVCGLIWEHS